MTLNEFLIEYKNIYDQCVDKKTGRIYFKLLLKVKRYLEKKYHLKNFRRILMLLFFCTIEDFRDANYDLNTATFVDPNDFDFFEKTVFYEYSKLINERDTLQSLVDRHIQNKHAREFYGDKIENLQKELNKLESEISRKNKNNSFHATLNEKQIEMMCHFLNDGYILNITKNKLHKIFDGNIQNIEQLKWQKTTRLLAFFFETLYNYDFISNNYKIIIERNKIFLSNGGTLIKANNLYVSTSAYYQNGEPKGADEIISFIKELKKFS